ncbi:MAG: hypothetical protein JNN05_09390 [Candidatus Omnitrophica bacterium]|nr:hypothetical protein [Candidatus Omnitrophota bacterium]
MKKTTMGVTLLLFLGVSTVNLAHAQGSQNQAAVAELAWKNLSIDFYDVKDKPQNGYRSMVSKSADDKGGKTFYVSQQPILGLPNTKSIDVTYNPADDDKLRLIIRFSDSGKQVLSEYSKAHLNEMMGVVIDGKLRLVATLKQPLTTGRVQVYGFEANEAVNILKRYNQPRLEMEKKLRAAQPAVPANKS